MYCWLNGPRPDAEITRKVRDINIAQQSLRCGVAGTFKDFSTLSLEHYTLTARLQGLSASQLHAVAASHTIHRH